MSEVAIAFTDGSEQDWGGPPTPVGGSSTPSGPAPAQGPPVALMSNSAPAGPDASNFEGAQVGMTEIKISGLCAIDAPDITVSLDDLIRAVGVYRVVKVLHYVHPKTGETVRQQILAPVEPLAMVPWDSANPNDDGVSRARP